MQNHPILPTFAELYRKYQLDDEVLWDIARTSGIAKSIIDVMIQGTPVERAEAESVLATFSQLIVGTNWTLENTDVPYKGEIPTFQRLCQRYKIDTNRLSTLSGVPIAIIDHMCMNQPVPVGDAMKVLQVLSRIAGKTYTFTTVTVSLDETRGTP